MFHRIIAFDSCGAINSSSYKKEFTLFIITVMFELLSLLSIFMNHEYDFQLNWGFYVNVEASQIPPNAPN